MNIVINRQSFLRELQDVVRAIPSKTAIPILKGIKLTANQEGLTLIASDSEISIEAFLGVDDEKFQLQILESGSLVVTARLFVEIIQKMPTDEVELKAEDFQLEIKSGEALFTLNISEGASYPKLPEIDSQEKIPLPTMAFKDLIQKTIFSASNEENRPHLTGLHLSIRQDTLVGSATDSHRLSRREISISHSMAQIPLKEMTLPKKTVTELTRIVEDQDELKMVVSEKQIVFFVKNLIIYSRLLEGNYPDIDAFIPADYTTRIHLNSEVFIDAIERASLLARQNDNNVVHLAYEDHRLTLSVLGNERGQANEVIPFQKAEGPDIALSFNSDFMKEALKSLAPMDVKIDILSEVRPLTVTADQEEAVDPKNYLLQLLTPIRTHY